MKLPPVRLNGCLGGEFYLLRWWRSPILYSFSNQIFLLEPNLPALPSRRPRLFHILEVLLSTRPD